MGKVYIGEKGVTLADSVYVGGDIGSGHVEFFISKEMIKMIYNHFILDEPFPKPEPSMCAEDFRKWVLGDKDD